jgi:hypothetical protein
VELYLHQEQALEKMHNGCVLWGGVGSGKSQVALAYHQLNEANKDIYIITTAKKRDSLDWEREASSYTLRGNLFVDSWNNIGKYVEVKDAFFVFDEQRLVGSGVWVRSFWRIAKKNKWILLSATPGDDWMDYVPIFVANGFYRNRSEFLREHVIFSRFTRYPRIERFVGEGKLVRLRKQLLVEMPYDKNTVRDTKIIFVDHDKDLMKRVVKDRWHVYENRPLRDAGEMYYVMRKVVNSDTSRITQLLDVLQEHPKVIVFYNFDYELELLRSLTELLNSNAPARVRQSLDYNYEASSEAMNVRTSRNSLKASTGNTNVLSIQTRLEFGTSIDGVQIAEWNGHKHEPIPDSDRWVYLVQYAAGAEGWNCVETDTMVFYSLTYSYKLFHQAHGRIDRLNTTFRTLNYCILMSDSQIDKGIMSALTRKKTFNEATFGLWKG